MKTTQAKTNLPMTVKHEIDRLTRNWGMSTSTYLRMAINQAIKDKTIPFKITTRLNVPVSYAKPNHITKEAAQEPGVKKYKDLNKMFKDAKK